MGRKRRTNAYMPRPTTKQQLLEQTERHYASLQDLLAPLTPEQLIAPGVVGDWSVKDVLAHLFAWQQMCLGWYRAGQQGETPVTPFEKYNWRQTPELNQEIYETHRDWALDRVRADFEASHAETLAAIQAMTDAELFEKGFYAWTRTSTLGSYLTSATSSHYEWAYKEIRRGLKP